MAMNWLQVAEDLPSSYQKNKLGWILYGLTLRAAPTVCVEFGVLHGYSTLFIAGALKELGKGHLYAFDRWPGHLPNLEQQVSQRVKDVGLSEFVTITTRDIQHNTPDIRHVDLAHVDIDNSGETVMWAMRYFGDRMPVGGTLVLEGGTPERDDVEWMAREGRLPFSAVLNNPMMMKGWSHTVIPHFPGMTILTKEG
jgi:hypothetical protein